MQVTVSDEVGKSIAAKQRDLELVLDAFIGWLDRYGETSWDHQSFYSGTIGRSAKRLYYSSPGIGVLAVAPMVLCEAFLPAARRLFWQRQRLPIADAHYAIGFSRMARVTGRGAYLDRAVHFLEVLKETSCRGYSGYCWGYPFDWVTRTGTINQGTPLITTTPYVYEAFAEAYALEGRAEWKAIMESIAEHAFKDITDVQVNEGTWAAAYYPGDTDVGIINASAYRAFLLWDASIRFDRAEYREAASRNLQYVLQSQHEDGSWAYDNRPGSFIDHFHTCFVLKALAKINALENQEACLRAIEAGVRYYVAALFNEFGLPKPFAVAPRKTVYRHELYDYAECINLSILLGNRCAALRDRLGSTVADLLRHWVKKDGSFRSRRLLFGWDNVPMHRWAQAQMFCSLTLLLQDMTARQRSPR